MPKCNLQIQYTQCALQSANRVMCIKLCDLWSDQCDLLIMHYAVCALWFVQICATVLNALQLSRSPMMCNLQIQHTQRAICQECNVHETNLQIQHTWRCKNLIAVCIQAPTNAFQLTRMLGCWQIYVIQIYLEKTKNLLDEIFFSKSLLFC